MTTSNDFIPKGASSFWPFKVGTNDAYLAPPWSAHLLLWLGLAEALLHLQPSRPRENWRSMPRNVLATLMHKPGAGKEHPSRSFVASLIREGETVLDVGCGAGVDYEVFAGAQCRAVYTGVDSSEPSIEIARKFYPTGDFRTGNATALVPQFGEESFDVVSLRHVLDHLPDFEPAMKQAIAVSRRLAVFVFFLTPRKLPFGVRKLDPGFHRSVFYTYMYSRAAINRFLNRAGMHWRWYDNLGVSRAGWLANEMNSALVVSRKPLEESEAG